MYKRQVLRKETSEVGADYPDLGKLIENMYETMYNAKGVGLAAPQVGLDLRLFVNDSTQMIEEDSKSPDKGIKRTFINAEIIEESGPKWSFEEGCLSIPDVRENVQRQTHVRIRYQDESFNQHEETFEGITARVIQHEYDHIEAVLFTDYLKPLKRRLLKKRLDNISKGKVSASYKMKFPAAR